MFLKLSLVAAALLSTSAHANVQCFKVESKGTSIIGQAYTEYAVAVRVDARNVGSIDFGNAEGYQEQASQACARAIAQSRCDAVQVDAAEAQYTTDADGRHLAVPAIAAHTGYKNSADEGTYTSKEGCEVSIGKKGLKAAKKVKNALRRELDVAAAKRRVELDASGWGPKM